MDDICANSIFHNRIAMIHLSSLLLFVLFISFYCSNFYLADLNIGELCTDDLSFITIYFLYGIIWANKLIWNGNFFFLVASTILKELIDLIFKWFPLLTNAICSSRTVSFIIIIFNSSFLFISTLCSKTQSFWY